MCGLFIHFLILKDVRHRTLTDARAWSRLWAAVGTGIDEQFLAIPQSLLKLFKDYLHVLDICVFLNQIDLVFMHKVVDIGDLLNETSSEELCLARLQVCQKIEYDNDQIVCFVCSTAISWCTTEGCHHFVHEPVDRDQLQDRAGNIPDVLELPEHLIEEYLCCFVVTTREIFTVNRLLECHGFFLLDRCELWILHLHNLEFRFLSLELGSVKRVSNFNRVYFEFFFEVFTVFASNSIDCLDDLLELRTLS